MPLRRPWNNESFEYHEVGAWTEDGEGWEGRCFTCEWFPFWRRLGWRKSLPAALRLAERHRQGDDAHARYLKAHPLPPPDDRLTG